MTAAYHRQGVLGAVGAWQTYAMIAGGFAGMFLLQSALQAGRLIVAQPGITLADPVVAILWGVLVFHEATRTPNRAQRRRGGTRPLPAGAGSRATRPRPPWSIGWRSWPRG